MVIAESTYLPSFLAPNFLRDPYGFFKYFILLNQASGYIMALQLAIVGTIVSFLFALLAVKLMPSLTFNNRLAKIVNTGIVTLIFWVFVRIWYVVFAGAALFPVGITNFLMTVVSSSAIVLPFAMLGTIVYDKLKTAWEMPLPLLIFITTLAVNTVFWLFFTYLLLNGHLATIL